MNNKRALSPMITTVLLIMIAIVLAAIILLWATGTLKEGVTKFGKPIEQSCSKIDLIAGISNNQLSLINQGTIPIYKIGLYLFSDGSSKIIVLNGTDLSPGAARVISNSEVSSDVKQVIPILLGSLEDGTVREAQCPKTNWVDVE